MENLCVIAFVSYTDIISILNFNSNKLDNKHMLKAAIEKIIIDMLLRNITFNDNIIV